MEGNRIRLASDFYITRDGTPAASIVVRTGAPDKVMEAARDLQDIIRRMSGAELPICDDAFRVEGNKILLGPSGYTRIHNVVFPEQKGEWCLLRRREDTLVLAGNDEGCYTGTQFAVTMLLERLGCGWFGPEELWQVIPQKKTLTVGYLDILHTPQFSCRRTRVLEKNPDIGRPLVSGGRTNPSSSTPTASCSPGSSISRRIPTGIACMAACGIPTTTGASTWNPGRCAIPTRNWRRPRRTR